MAIFCKGKFKGMKAEVKAKTLLNTGADYAILPRWMAEKISPKPMGEEEFELANGSIVRRRVYEVEVEIQDHAGKRRGCKSLSTIEERLDPAIGFQAMKKIKLIPNPAKGKAYFE